METVARHPSVLLSCCLRDNGGMDALSHLIGGEEHEEAELRPEVDVKVKS